MKPLLLQGLLTARSKCIPPVIKKELDPAPGYKFFADIDAESEANQPHMWQDEHCSDCQLCGVGGDLLVCDMCTWVFHPGCLTPAVDPAAIPAGLFACCGECIAAVQDTPFVRS